MNSQFSAVLLAGGKSSRMGRNKAFLEIDGVPLWHRQLRILEELRPLEIFLAGPSHADWNNAGCEIIADAQTDSGPLAGLVAALRRCSTSHLLTLAVDLPRITSGYLADLLRLCEKGKGVVPRSDRFEPLVAVYPITSLVVAEQFLRSGLYSLQEFARQCVADGLVIERPIAVSEEALFLNANTPADLVAVRL